MFDYEVVIVDSADVFATTFLAASRACGYTGIKTHEQVMRLFDGNFFEALAQLGLSSDKIDEILGDAFERKMRRHKAEVKPFHGIHGSLKVISRRNVLTVITSNDSRIVWQFFEKEDIDCFDEVVGAEIERSKVRKIQKTMGRYQGLPAYYVGDTKGDMIEGKKAGAVTVAVTWGWHSAEKLNEASPDHMVHTMAELETLLS
ncbi:MAG: HAD family hydrolase [Desulfobacterales bacterium]|nr:HAD family hydrolase [Desulfobacterales bacterium]MDX2512239.1 HAD family hydrolase [Desulfobacterales bacterium]